MTTSTTEELLIARSRALTLLLQERKFGTEYWKLQDEVLELERAVAAERGTPYAVPWSPGESWNGMAPYPAVLGNALECTITFAARPSGHAVMCFRGIAGYKLTDVSDETIEGHPLTGKGLISHRTFLVKNSPWIAELEAIDRTHPHCEVKRWGAMQHYLLCFKDRMFEAVAGDVQLLGCFDGRDEALRCASSRFVLHAREI